MNVLSLTSNAYRYQIDGPSAPGQHTQSDYVIDGDRLGPTVGFEGSRPWFGQTCFEMSEPSRSQLILQLRGIKSFTNQFGNNRFILYFCHCGDEYCGVISCQIDRTEQAVIWTDIRYEDDFDADEDPLYDFSVSKFLFSAEQYDSAIEHFCRRGT